MGLDKADSNEKRPLPKTIFFNITNRCDSNCRHCYVDSGKTSNEMNKEEIFSMIDDLSSSGIKKLIINGGEPFMREDLFEIIEACNVAGLSVSLTTNGKRLNYDDIRRLSGKLRMLSFSLDGATSETHDYLRGDDGSFEKVLKNLRLAKEAGHTVNIFTVLSKLNKSQIDEILDLAVKNHADSIAFLYCSPFGRALDNEKELVIGHSDWLEISTLLKRRQSELEDKIKIIFEPKFLDSEDEGFYKSDYEGCSFFTSRYCAIDHEGNVFFCSLFMNKGNEYSLGNIRSKEFLEIWNNSEKWGFFFEEKGRQMERCKPCKSIDFCKSFCFAYWMLKSEEIPPECRDGVIPLCYMYWDDPRYRSA